MRSRKKMLCGSGILSCNVMFVPLVIIVAICVLVFSVIQDFFY